MLTQYVSLAGVTLTLDHNDKEFQTPERTDQLISADESYPGDGVRAAYWLDKETLRVYIPRTVREDYE